VADRVIASEGTGAPLGLNEDQQTVLRMLQCGGARLESAADGARALVQSERGWQSASCQNPNYPALWAAQTSRRNPHPIDDAPFLADLSSDELTTVITLGPAGRPARTAVWAGAPERGTLLESWERTSEAIVPADQLPANTFSAQPHPAAIRLAARSAEAIQTLPAVVLEPSSLAAAAQRARSPLLGFGTAPDAPQLQSIYVPGPPNSPQITYLGSDNTSAFGAALNSGYAILSAYNISTTTGVEALMFYQGAAPELRAYLRSSAIWSDSGPTTVQIGDQAIAGWRVAEPSSNLIWLLFELDGTLVAVVNPSPSALAVLGQLQRVDVSAP
jgi:hypothetical protein